MTQRWARQNVSILAAILVFYMITGIGYACLTPLWETPDEPAHYNYIRYLIRNRSLPVLQEADYDYDYLERIKAAKFPPEMSIDSIRYEFHQPPLYYVLGATLAAPLPEAWQPAILRLMSIFLGALLLVIVYLTAAEIFPDRIFWALGATALVATVPMHVAMTAAVNNDTLAELILGLILLTLVRRITRHPDIDFARNDLLLGILVGLGLVTKTTTYIAVPLVLVVILAPYFWRLARSPELRSRARNMKQTLASAGRTLGIALLVSAWWFLRNSLVYGGADVLGLVRHNSIMTDQPHTVEWVARLGWVGLAREFLLTTFRSFWAQFGWMGILVDERIYWMLALLFLLTFLGFILFLFRDFNALRVEQKLCLGLLCLSFSFTLLSYLWYNLQFVQHQGRYLFPALIPLGVFFAIGCWTLLDRCYAHCWAVLLLLGALAMGLKGWLEGQINKWLIALLGGAGVLFGLRSLLPSGWRTGLYALPFLGLWVLDVICLLAFIVPHFQT